MGLTTGTAVVNGQRVTVPTADAYNPVGFGQIVQMQPIQNINVPPMVGGGTGGTGGAVSGQDVVGGYGTANLNSAATLAANANPFSLRASPVLWAVGGLVVSLVLLRVISWRKVTLAGAGEHAHIGSANESADANV